MLGRDHALVLDRIGAVLAVAVGLAVSGGCHPGARAVSASEIQALESGQRVAAIRRAVDAEDRAMIPLLIDRLEDEDAAVRFAAIMGLEQLTGTRMGYRVGLSIEKRRQAVARWRRTYCSRSSSIGDADSSRRPVLGDGDYSS